MSHVVLSRNASGEPRIDEVETLDGALRQVERLRNDEGMTDVRILREVPIEVKTYYKVVAVDDTGGGVDRNGGSPAGEQPTPIAAAPATAPPVAPTGSRTDPPSGSAVLSPLSGSTSSAASTASTAGEDLDGLVTDRRSSRFGRG